MLTRLVRPVARIAQRGKNIHKKTKTIIDLDKYII